jgi:uncharacterized protein (TIGR03435 family)
MKSSAMTAIGTAQNKKRFILGCMELASDLLVYSSRVTFGGKGSIQHMRLSRCVCVATLACAAGAWAQPARLIEVASVKPSPNTTADSNLDSARGRLTATNITARELIRLAYGVRDYQIGPVPGWVDSQRFDIAAKSAGGAGNSLEDEKALVRELLADQFQLATHREAKQMPVYLLVLAKDGPKLTAHSDAAPRLRGGCGRLVGRRVTADGLAAMLSRQLEHDVVNRTGLSGEYDVQLDFTPDSGPCREAGDSALPSLDAAVQQKLGLKLEASKGAVDMLVVDRVVRPSGN